MQPPSACGAVFADSAYRGAFSSAVLHGTCVVDQMVLAVPALSKCEAPTMTISTGTSTIPTASKCGAQVPGYRMLLWCRDSGTFQGADVDLHGEKGFEEDSDILQS